MAGLYIHIPLCAQRCGYCDFYSSTSLTYRPRLLEQIKVEMASRRDYLEQKPLHTIYIGGGTPSLCSPAELQDLIDTAKGLWGGSSLTEVTVEANPDDLTMPYLEQLAKTDINRLSIGIQSFIERDLAFMNRRHSAKTAIDAVKRAQKTGFDNITIDLIYGIPGMSIAEWRSNLEQALALGVQHISAYHLTIEDNTPLGRKLLGGEISQVDEEVSEEQFLLLRKMLIEGGFEHYEISNFATPGRRAIHNSSYWSGESYLGVGPSAHSYNGHQRDKCAATIERYVSSDNLLDLLERELLTDYDRHNEFVMTSLRCSEGVDLSRLEALFGSSAKEHFLSTARQFIESGTMLLSETHCSIAAEKLLLSDSLISAFFLP